MVRKKKLFGNFVAAPALHNHSRLFTDDQHKLRLVVYELVVVEVVVVVVVVVIVVVVVAVLAVVIAVVVTSANKLPQQE